MSRLLKIGMSLVSALLFVAATAEAVPITIAWDANSEPGVTGYVVSYGNASGQYGVTVDVGNATTWTLANALEGRTYYFTVQAYNRDGFRSARAAEVSEYVTPSNPNLPHAPPFGQIDTPVNGATGVAGSIAVSGWALDERGISSVAIYRDRVNGEPAGDPIFLGNAVRIEGARPDVAAAYPTLPGNTRAGWGLLVLTNVLPNRGNGTYRLHAIATDTSNGQTHLGSRTITCTNDLSPNPFGAIDTPTQGETISGSSYNNFGWVLSPGQRRSDGPGGGTVRVVIDGVPVGTPTGWTSRGDLSSIFPISQYSGVNTALAVFTFDTRQLSNGIHTIAWSVADNQASPNGAGIGSRYFTVNNGAALTETVAGESSLAMTARSVHEPADVRDEIAYARREAATVSARRGFSLRAPFRTFNAGADGVVTIEGEEMDRFEVRLGAGDTLTGHMRSGAELIPLPIGSHLDAAAGTFTWQPGVGFVGAYDLVFVRSIAGTTVAAQDLRIVLNPKASGRVGPQVIIDTPTRQEAVGQSFVMAGWALDLDADNGNGVEALHVWAYPVDGADPIFVGSADRGGQRPDVAALHGERFRDSGYGLVVKGLAPGDYDMAVFAWSTAAGDWVPASTVRVTVR